MPAMIFLCIQSILLNKYYRENKGISCGMGEFLWYKKNSDVRVRRAWILRGGGGSRGRVGCPEHSVEELHPILQTLPSVGWEKTQKWVIPPELPLKCKYEFYLRCVSAASGVHGQRVPGVTRRWVALPVHPVCQKTCRLPAQSAQLQADFTHPQLTWITHVPECLHGRLIQ